MSSRLWPAVLLVISFITLVVPELHAQEYRGAAGSMIISTNDDKRLQRPGPATKSGGLMIEGTSAFDTNHSLISSTPDLVVAQDGSGNYTTISEALRASTRLRTTTKRFVIHIKRGHYKDSITKSMINMMLIGDGMDATVVTGNKNARDHTDTYLSATFAVDGDGFIAQYMTFENTAGPQKEQAVALRSSSDFSVFYRCSFKGYQDTLYAFSGHQFYRECDIYGTIDFIFGDATAVFQSCNILVRRPMDGQQNVVTAQGRENSSKATGFSFHMSKVMAAPDLKPVQHSFKTYFGRPWKTYSRTVFMMCDLDDLIDPLGWVKWDSNTNYRTLYYGEYMNKGAGAGIDNRVKWPGFHILNRSEANKFTVANFINGSSWIQPTGVPFTPGL